MAFDVISFGGSVIDVFVKTDVKDRGKSICYPIGTKLLIKDLKFDVGGGAINTSSAFSRLGLKSGCITKVGDDLNGKKILKVLKKEKVKFLGKIEKGAMSGYSVILDSQDDDRTILTYKGVNEKINFEDLPLRKIKTKWIYYSSAVGKSLVTQKRLARMLYDRGVKLAFNPSSYLIEKKDIDDLLQMCYVLVLNHEEAEIFAKRKKFKSRDLLKELHNLGPKIVVITNSEKPVMCYDGVKKYSLMPHKVKIVEKTGAGDAFASGFVSGLIAGKGIEYSLKLGLRESESVIRYFGARNNLLRMQLKKRSFFSG